MKTYKLTLPLVIAALLLATTPVQADDSDSIFVAPLVDYQLQNTDPNNDCWSNVSEFHDVEELGTGGFVKFSNNGTHLFTLFTIDANLRWVSLEFDADPGAYMTRGHDGITIYLDKASETIEVYDETFDGASGVPSHDQQDNLDHVFQVKDGFFEVQVSKPIESPDANDAKFVDGELTNIVFASSQIHYGSHPMYFLCIQFTEGDLIIPKPPEIVDYGYWKSLMLTVGLITVISFVTLHILIRQVLRPLSHPPAVVDSSFAHPTFQSRWHDTFGSKFQSQTDELGREVTN